MSIGDLLESNCDESLNETDKIRTHFQNSKRYK